MLTTLDIVLHFLHLTVIVVNCFFWMGNTIMKKLFLWVFSLTIISWLGFGLKYGIGYCFLTDIHWNIKRDLGETLLPPSYIHYIFEYFLGWPMNRDLVDTGVGLIFVALFFVYLRLVFPILSRKRKGSS